MLMEQKNNDENVQLINFYNLSYLEQYYFSSHWLVVNVEIVKDASI